MEKTIKQIADELGVSKQAVRNEIAKQKLQSTLQKNANQFAIDEQTEILIKTAILKRKNANLTAKVNANVSQSICANPSDELFDAKSKISQLELELKLQKASEKEKAEIYIAEIQRMTQELRAKDDIINEQLRQLSDMYKVIGQAQALHAGTIQQQLSSGSSSEQEQHTETKEKKKRWWQR